VKSRKDVPFGVIKLKFNVKGDITRQHILAMCLSAT